ncbi:phage gp6-like head-tail connector protein [Sphingomonas sp. R-74633]|uniref:head-tail connector protein n=1 Tax=Sphingomonas sp. R-74633 TaxID=2751188 RepID=UPI0015D39072|nr:head-tail connector protein [Sphingomonas sp. R-74633]NYT43109.1 phage gp6-like head-tail connector protein [Sphingomonas sp. R-74633]
MRVVVVTPPATPVISLEAAKKHLRVDGNDDDTLIAGYVAAVANHLSSVDQEVRGALGRSLGKRELEARFSAPRGRIMLPFPPVIELISVKYLDRDNVEQVADLEDFELLGAELVAAGPLFPWENGNMRREAIRVRYRAGYDEIPAEISTAMLLMVGDLYANRESTIAGSSAAAIEIPMSTNVKALLDPVRVYR